MEQVELQPSPPAVLPSSQASAPLVTPSPQAAAWHMPPVHTPLWQSLPVPQAWPSAQRLPWLTQVEPPQSTSVSAPFFTVSAQAGT